MEKKILLILLILILISGCYIGIGKPNNESYFEVYVGNQSQVIFRNVTAMFIIDCSLPEVYENKTVEMVYGEIVYNNTNTIEIPFTEFCKRLKPTH